MTFETAGICDLTELRNNARESEAHWGYDKAFMDIFDRDFNISKQFLSQYPVYISRIDGRIAAFWGVIPDGNQCELEYFYISRESLNKGYGKQMWNHLTDWCRKQGIEKITFVTSWQAIGFYEKMGARQDGLSKSVIDGRDIPHFVYMTDEIISQRC